MVGRGWRRGWRKARRAGAWGGRLAGGDGRGSERTEEGSRAPLDELRSLLLEGDAHDVLLGVEDERAVRPSPRELREGGVWEESGPTSNRESRLRDSPGAERPVLGPSSEGDPTSCRGQRARAEAAQRRAHRRCERNLNLPAQRRHIDSSRGSNLPGAESHGPSASPVMKQCWPLYLQ